LYKHFCKINITTRHVNIIVEEYYSRGNMEDAQGTYNNEEEVKGLNISMGN
jgi:hypothetical protein